MYIYIYKYKYKSTVNCDFILLVMKNRQSALPTKSENKAAIGQSRVCTEQRNQAMLLGMVFLSHHVHSVLNCQQNCFPLPRIKEKE